MPPKRTSKRLAGETQDSAEVLHSSKKVVKTVAKKGSEASPKRTSKRAAAEGSEEKEISANQSPKRSPKKRGAPQEGDGSDDGREDGKKRQKNWPNHLKSPRDRARCAMWSVSLRETDAYKKNPKYIPGTNWLISEKMDGQYMYWPGYSQQMYARGRGGRGDANPQNPPPSFTKWLPKGIALEGELAHFSGEASRGQQAKKDGWKDACFWVFDAPEMDGPYKDRLAHLQKLEKQWDKRYVRVVPLLGVTSSHAVLVSALDTVVARGGEGLMIRDPDAPYEFIDPNSSKSKHTDKLFKFKPFDDVECKVLGMNASGARGYQCVLPNGIEFGLSSINGVKCGKAGTIVNITCQGFLANGKPQYPKAIAVRKDRPWSDYVAAWKLREGKKKTQNAGHAAAQEAQKLLLANKYSDKNDPSGWWMSEKLDGLRAYWNGKDLYSRQGNLLAAPKWFIEDLPKEPLDGELWCGRGLFQKTLGIVKGQKPYSAGDWKFVTYLVFDAPKRAGKFEQRVAWLKKKIRKEKESTYAAVVGQRECESRDHMKTTLQHVLKKGGEGLMLRQPGSAYVSARSDTLLKVKYFHDEECKVSSVEAHFSKPDSMYRLHCDLPNGKTFSLSSGFSAEQRALSFFKSGDVLTFKYEAAKNGVPQFPVFLRSRSDLTWKDVLNNAKTKPPFTCQAPAAATEDSSTDSGSSAPPSLKKQHSILFATVPSRDNLGGKIITTDDEDSGDDDEEKKTTTKRVCKFGAKCFRKNKAHFEQFDHPDLKNVKNDMVDPADEEAKNESVQDAGESEDEEDAGGEAAAGPPQLKRGISIEVAKADVNHRDKYYDLGISDDDMADEGAAQSSWGIGSDDDDDKEEMVTVSKKSLAKIHSQLKQLQQQLEIE
mmetsp:Transcript_42285/g.82999  ORF Transcript_42285/g.82999 Transcript_42285/m.82999 type:complete len:881 (-) Transcript_42285:66-2708(-)